MKAKMIFLGLCLISISFGGCSQQPAKADNKPVASNCEGTCSGGANCTACKNCKYCKHCAKQGGTCSVCKKK